jgi:2-hydroxy-6-oxonona-2,4-dienedioate hydrolase
VGEFESIWSDLQGVPFSQGYLNAGGVRTRYLHAGDPGKPALVFLHGSGGHAEAYVRNLEAHAEHFSTWSIDMLGHGYTDKPGHPLEVRHYVDHLIAFLSAIGAERAHISGESLGGWVAARAAVDHPDRIDRLVLNTAGGSQADPEVMKRIITLSMAAAENPTWETVQARIKWLMAEKSKDYDDIVASRQRVYRQPGFVAAMKDIMALQDPEIRARNLLGSAEYGAITRRRWSCGRATIRPPTSQKVAAWHR